MTESRVEQARRKAEQEIQQAEREDLIAAGLPFAAHSIYAHKDYASVKVELKLDELPAFVETIASHVVEAEVWRASCLSILPAEINKYATDERAVMDGAAWAQLEVQSYGESRRYYTNAFLFWLRLPVGFVKLEIEVPTQFAWHPKANRTAEEEARFGVHVQFKKDTIVPKFLGEDQRRKWSSEAPSYRLTYEWADRSNFESWLTTPDAKGGY